MSTIADGDDLRVVAGVDTHKDVHVAVVLDELGRLLEMASFPATARGYRNLTGWVALDIGEHGVRLVRERGGAHDCHAVSDRVAHGLAGAKRSD